MAERLIVVSNRIPMGDNPSGGLVVALHDALARSGGVWLGAHPETGDGSEPLEEVGRTPSQRLAFRLTQEQLDNYYLGFSNSVLWPLCHRRGDLIDMQRDYVDAYSQVNARVAQLIADIVTPDDLIWIHDYHFFPLARELRALGVLNRIGFFLHIPFPALGDLSMLPEPESFADCLAHYNLIGLQTRGDVARCLEMFRADPRAEFLPDGNVKFLDRVVSLKSFPIGIDAGAFRAEALQDAPSPFGRETPERYLIGVDRLDYSKGLPNRFRAFARYLENRTTDTRPCFVQIAPPSREQVQAYQDITRELEEIAGNVNGRFAELDWTPIRYIHRPVPRGDLARLHRKASACLVTSTADGMNLVAKEFVAAQDPEDPGVLVLSRFAGAAEDMTEAVLVNPYDVDEMARAIGEALDMPLEERQRRHDACLKIVEQTGTAQWSHDFLHALRTCIPPLGG